MAPLVTEVELVVAITVNELSTTLLFTLMMPALITMLVLLGRDIPADVVLAVLMVAGPMLITPLVTNMLVPSGLSMPANELDPTLMLALITPDVTNMLVPSGLSIPAVELDPSLAAMTPDVTNMLVPSGRTTPMTTVVAVFT